MRLRARLCPRPRILFVGINPSLASAQVGHHFAGPGNPFYRLLHAAGLVPEPMTFADDVRLPEFGLALTNIAERATREAAELTAVDYARGRRRLARTIATIRPAVVAFVGSTAYREFVGPSGSHGAGAKPARRRCRLRGAQPQRPQRRLSGVRRQARVVPTPQALGRSRTREPADG